MSESWSKSSLVEGVGRRRFLTAGAQLGAMTAASLILPGCASPGSIAASHPSATTLRIGMAGGSTTDSFDVRTYTDSVAIALGYQVMNGFIEIDAKRQAGGELFESWEVKPGGTSWSFKLRQGVSFHNGKSFGIDDAIYSINLHRGSSTSKIQGIMQNVAEVHADGPDRVNILLHEGDADFLYVLGDYHLLAVPDGFTDWSHPIGTGAFKFEMYEPGRRAVTVRQANYWKSGTGNVQAVELTVINDDNTRVQALRSDQVDVINRVPSNVAASIEGQSGIALVRAHGGYHVDYAMNTGTAPFDNPDLRMALKCAIDREAFVRDLTHGYGHVGNDHPIPVIDPFFNSELPQRTYDPDKVKFHLRKSGLENAAIELGASEATYKGAIDMAEMFAGSSALAGLKFSVRKVPANSFWDNTWMKVPFFASYWGGRPSATEMLTVAYASSAAWNETNWRRSDFDNLLHAAKTEIGIDKRRHYIWEMQAMLNQEGGAIIPAFMDFLDAHRSRVQGHTPYGLFDFCNGRLAEKVSLSA